MVQSPTCRTQTAHPPPRHDVVIVEDEPISRRALQLLVAANGYSTRAFASAEEALGAVAVDGLPSVVLVDFHLPGMNGIEFIRRIEIAGPAVLPVLITAAGSDLLDSLGLERSLLCLRKPLDFARLLTVLSDRASNN